MTLLGHIRDGQIVPDEPISLPEGAPVRIEFLEERNVSSEDAILTAARERTKELFRTVKGFRMTPKIPREELYERGSLR